MEKYLARHLSSSAEELPTPARWILEHTFCKFGRHSSRKNSIRKFDSGRCPLLCRHCRKIIGTWRGEARNLLSRR